MTSQGTVYWLTGFAGAGKTTIGTALYEKIKESTPAVVLLDGDSMREAFGGDLGYTVEDRSKCAMRYSRLCKLISEQGIIVVCCTISMFNEVRQWNRNNITKYVEVYIKADFDTLEKRDQKQLYSGNAANMPGVDMKMQTPENPDIVIENDKNGYVAQHVDSILMIS